MVASLFVGRKQLRYYLTECVKDFQPHSLSCYRRIRRGVWVMMKVPKGRLRWRPRAGKEHRHFPCKVLWMLVWIFCVLLWMIMVSNRQRQSEDWLLLLAPSSISSLQQQQRSGRRTIIQQQEPSFVFPVELVMTL